MMQIDSHPSVTVSIFITQLSSFQGRQKALRLLGSSANVQADEALSLGLIDGIVQDTKCDAPASEAEVPYSECSDDTRLHSIFYMHCISRFPLFDSVASRPFLLLCLHYVRTVPSTAFLT